MRASAGVRLVTLEKCGNQAYTAKNAPVATSLLTSCKNLFQQADISVCSHGLRQLVDDKSVAS